MDFIISFILFVFFSNAVLLLLLENGFKDRIGSILLLFFSYGVGPFSLALIFYTSIWLFPARNDLFYEGIISGIYLLIYFLCRKKLLDAYKLHVSLFLEIKDEAERIPKILILIAAIFISLYTIQLIAFPIVDNDSVLYLNQSEAVYEYKNLDWQKKIEVTIDGSNIYSYNYTIRPGIPALVSATYLFLDSLTHSFASFKFLILYYYLLLLFIFLYSIRKFSGMLHTNIKYSLSYGLLFFVFSWALTRGYIFSAKESIIYFFALLSIIITTSLLKRDNNDWQKRILLSVLLGVNTFINLHGIIIECLIILLLFIFSKQSFIRKIVQSLFIFLLSIPFGGGELLAGFSYLFISPSRYIVPLASGNGIITMVQKIYQTGDVLSEYVRGKLQILTNIGIFGFYFWLYLLVLIKYFKKIVRNDFLKIIFYFIFFYYVFIIDPFSLNPHPLSIILWGSSKYAMLLVFLSMIIVSVFVNNVVNWLVKVINSNNGKLLLLGGCLLLLVIALRTNIIDLGTKLLLLIVPAFKNVIFYKTAIERFFILSVAVLILFLVTLVIVRNKKKSRLTYSFVNIFLVFIIVVPFFITNVGKVALYDTFLFTNKNQKEMLEITLSEADIFKVYFMSQEMLPNNAKLATDYNEISLYNNGRFTLGHTGVNKDYSYIIAPVCDSEWGILFKSGDVYLCKKNESY